MVETDVRRDGAVGQRDGSLRWRVWAPRVQRVELVRIDGDQRRAVPMQREERGYFHHTEANVLEGQRYAYRLDGGPERPDPCSLWQPDSVHGPSAVVRPEQFSWTDGSWRGVPRGDLVFYELHVGTFTPQGTFEAVISRLNELRELGVTAVEIMPVGQFPDSRNWGYDGVLPYAVQNSYGGPHGLQKLVDACHAAGLAIFLDVIYNHFGPEGNYLAEFGPYFTDHYKTPWGKAVNYDGPGSDAVRDYVCNNARMWLQEFHFDGLRLDAVHAIYDFSARHILRDVQKTAESVAEHSGRAAHIIAESDLNDPRLLYPRDRGGHQLDGQWSDDFHHAIHAFLTGERRGYYQDFGSPRQIAEVMVKPFLYAGGYSPHRHRKHGAPPEGLAGDRFVVCVQNHDQVGNRARGDRLLSLLGNPAKQRLASSMLLLSPYLPLLFMGEEYGEDNPFPFFCSFGDPSLIEAVRQGRKQEFSELVGQGEVPDPQAETTFASARLSWSWPEGTPRAGLRRLYQDLLTARREWPALRDFESRASRLLPNAETGSVLELLRGLASSEGQVRILFNLSEQAQPLPGRAIEGQQTLFSSESTRYGGERKALGSIEHLLPAECIVMGPASWRTLS
ncbi:MAG TPA: malto-oligosyltrehalose trehalohydrolase [Gemmataceae bacterium]|nr:malto-oligosyltrehalose trehalohydrolase [Gemmataceae bacterium]